MQAELLEVANLTGVDLNRAINFKRQHPLFNEEINISEELINLEEAVKTYNVAAHNLSKYPNIKKHLQCERRLVLEHVVGLIARMLNSRQIPSEYNDRDIEISMKKLVRLLISDALRHGYRINRKSLDILMPLISMRQKFLVRNFSASLNPLQCIRVMFNRVIYDFQPSFSH